MFDIGVGEHGEYLYLVVQFVDESYVYQSGGMFEPNAADTVELIVRGENAERQSVYFGTAGPGPVTAYNIIENWDFSVARRPVNNIVGEWRETD